MRLAQPNDDYRVSSCCRASIRTVTRMGVRYGVCTGCNVPAIRINPRTDCVEWLEGASPWSEQDAPGSPSSQPFKNLSQTEH